MSVRSFVHKTAYRTFGKSPDTEADPEWRPERVFREARLARRVDRIQPSGLSKLADQYRPARKPGNA